MHILSNITITCHPTAPTFNIDMDIIESKAVKCQRLFANTYVLSFLTDLNGIKKMT